MSKYKLDYGDNYCPICDNHTLEQGERIDFFQVIPDTCDFCGYVQPKNQDEFQQLSQIAKCWELQIDFWGRE